MSPEKIFRLEYDAKKQDFFALGVTLFCLRAGYLPFHEANPYFDSNFRMIAEQKFD